MNPELTSTSALGFSHYLAHADGLSLFLFSTLIIMSALSWYFIITKSIAMHRMKKRSALFLSFFWNASTLDAVATEIETHGAQDPFSQLTTHSFKAQQHHARYGSAKLIESGSEQDFLTRTMKKVLDEQSTQLENGLTLLATIGSTAPFVGLFGTVWGIYHALLAIGSSGVSSIDTVAGPVGEALIMTGIGLGVAIPAVMGYNWLTRSNRVLLAELDAFAHELLTFLCTGQPIVNNTPSNVRSLPTTSKTMS